MISMIQNNTFQMNKNLKRYRMFLVISNTLCINNNILVILLTSENVCINPF